MTSRRALLISLTLFAVGLAGAWIMPVGNDDPPRKPTDPSPAHARVPGIPGLPEPSGLPGDFIHLQEIQDPRHLRAAWLAAADESDRWPLARRWAALDPEGAVRFLLVDNVDGAARDASRGELLLEDWLRKDPSAALRFLGKSPEVTAGRFWFLNSRAAFANAVKAGLRDAPAETMALFRAGPPTVKALMCGGVFQHLFTANPAQALAEMEHLSPSLCRDGWSRAQETADPAALLRLMEESRNTSCPPDYYALIFKAYARMDPDAARGMAETLPPGPRREAACSVILEKMAETDPDTALSWMEAHAPSLENRKVVYEALAQENPARSLELCSRNQVPFFYEITRYIRDLSARDWSAAENLLLNAPSPWARNRIISALAHGMNTQHGTALSDLPKLGGMLAQARSGAGETVLHPYQFSGNTSAELPALMDWVARQSDKAMEEILPPLTQRLGKEEPKAAATWLLQLPPGTVRTEALIRNTSAWAAENPQEAADFSLSLPPGRDRDYAVLNTALAWQRHNPAAARQWLDGLPESPAKTRALQELGGISKTS